MPDSPYYRFFRRFDVKMPFKQWRRLPRLPGYKNEYWDGEAHYSPRPRACDVYLDLRDWSAPRPPEEFVSERRRVAIRQLRDEDWPELPTVFRAAFGAQPPLSGWGDRGAQRASRVILEWTRRGGDGPVVPGACFVAREDEGGRPAGERGRHLCGAAIVTLAPFRLLQAPPAGAAVPQPGQPEKQVVPHLDWIFVGLWSQRHGIGSMLLESVVAALKRKGFSHLASTCSHDNAASLLWHWHNGFQLPAGQWGSMRYRRVEDGVSKRAKSKEETHGG